VSRLRAFFVTGTDTGVGKTTVGCALARAFRKAGRRVAVLKPIETGCASRDGELLPADALRLADAAGSTQPVDVLCPNRYPLPTSPEVAAQDARRPVDFAAIDAARERLAANADVLLIEGAGGLLVPLAAGYLTTDLIAHLAVPLLIVARASLGTVNHTLLTVEAARRRHLPVLGIVLNRVLAEAGPDEPTNAAAIEAHGTVHVFGTLPHAANAGPDTLAELAEQHLDLQGLWQAL
jgi:dethiobiotin synthetase